HLGQLAIRSITMQIAIIGLGKMGGNMVQRLLLGKHSVVVFDRDPKAVAACVDKGAVGATSLADLLKKLQPPRAVWVMVPAGDPTENTIKDVAELMTPGDTIIDGGNSNWKDSQRRCKELKPKGIDFIDAGTSGGIWGLKNGYCLMVGGDPAAVERCKPAF